MEITDKCITHKNIKGLISMSSTSKTQDWGNNYSEMRRVLRGFKTEELELRKTSLGKELM
jgi:hypothetical protein